jgi:HSP20 family protein
MKKHSDIDRLHDEIQELIDELWQVPRFAGGRRGFRPQVDCIRSEEPPALHVVVELPGVEPSEIQVIAADRVLVVAGVRRPPLRGRYQQMEIEYGPFRRVIALGADVVADKAKAVYEDGVLRVELPLAQPGRGARKVPIEVPREGRG